MNCPFCMILREQQDRIIRQTEYTFTVLSDPRLMSGHLLVIPKKHAEKFSELVREERYELFDETVRWEEIVLRDIASGCDISQHYRPFIPQSKLKIDHLHIHIRPREFEDELYRKVQVHEKDVFAALSEDELRKFSALLSDK